MSNPSVINIEKEASSLGISINHLCEKAEIARSTFTRLKSGDTESGNVSTIKKLENAILKIKRSSENKKTK